MQKQVKEFLESVGAEVWVHTNALYGVNGVSDICGTLPGGRAVWAEVKRSKAKAKIIPASTSKAQKHLKQQQRFLDKHKKLGALAQFVYPENFAEFREEVRKYIEGK